MDSLVWFERFFPNQEITGIAQCRQCMVNIKFSKKSRTNCKDHARKHKSEWKHFEEEKATKELQADNQHHLFPIDGTLTITSGLLPRSNEANIKLRKVLSYSIGCSVAPINIVNSPVVIKLVRHLAPRLSLPSNKTIQKYIDSLAVEQFLTNKLLLESAISYSLGVDGWTYSRRQCLAITCFAFWEDGSSRRLFLDLIGVEDQKAATVREVCQTLCKSLNLDDKKLTAIVADNCSAMRATLRSFTLDNALDEEDLASDILQDETMEKGDTFTVNDLDDDCDQVEYVESLEYFPPSSMTKVIYMYGCLAHKIQLVIRDAMRVRQVEELVTKVKNIVRFIRRPRFRSVVKTVPLANDTRWSSCYHMKDWAEQRFDQNNDPAFTQLPSSQLMDLDDDHDSIGDADNFVELSLEKMMDLYPRKKMKMDRQMPSESEIIEISLEEEIEKFELFIGEHGIKPNTLKTGKEPSPFQEKGSFPQWWISNGNKFPLLQKISFSMCGVQPSNGGVERVFSYCKMLFEGRRNRISIESLRNRMLVLMNSQQ